MNVIRNIFARHYAGFFFVFLPEPAVKQQALAK